MTWWHFIDLFITWAALATWLACVALQIYYLWKSPKKNPKKTVKKNS